MINFRNITKPITAIIETALIFKGNARVCVYMEPLFAIPMTLYSSFMTLFMLEMGMNKSQVGFVSSLGMAVHIFFAIISVYITDKIGRRYATFIFDMIGWGGVHLIWLFANNIYFFIVAAIINAFGRVVMNSWHCLVLEDSEPESRIHIFNFLTLAGIAAGFFAPIGAWLVDRLTLVPAMRVMFVIAFVSMMALFVIRHLLVVETSVGKQKMREMKGVSVWSVFNSYPSFLRRLVRNRLLMIILLVRAFNFIQMNTRGMFLAVLVTERLGFPKKSIALFQISNAAVMLMILMFVAPVMSRITRRWPISLGVCFLFAANVILVLSPQTQNYFLLIASAIIIAFGNGLASPRIDSVAANMVANADRSVANAVMGIILLAISMPFGYIGGGLAGIDVRLPFLLILALHILCLILLQIAAKIEKSEDAAAANPI